VERHCVARLFHGKSARLLGFRGRIGLEKARKSGKYSIISNKEKRKKKKKKKNWPVRLHIAETEKREKAPLDQISFYFIFTPPTPQTQLWDKNYHVARTFVQWPLRKKTQSWAELIFTN
jgi:hypothetical protein